MAEAGERARAIGKYPEGHYTTVVIRLPPRARFRRDGFYSALGVEMPFGWVVEVLVAYFGEVNCWRQR